MNEDLSEFFQWYSAKEKSTGPNLFQLAKHGMPGGAGRKGNKPKRNRSKTVLRGDGPIPLMTTLDGGPSTIGSETPTLGSGTPSFGKGPPSLSGGNATLGSGTPTLSGGLPTLGGGIPTLGSGAPTLGGGPPQLQFPLGTSSNHGPLLPAEFPAPPLPFKLVLLAGKISVCNGCRQRFPRTPSGCYAAPPYNMVIQHMEERQFNSPITSMPTSRLGNAYYHVFLPCLQAKWPAFQGNELVIDPGLKAKLQPEHKHLLLTNLGITCQL